MQVGTALDSSPQVEPSPALPEMSKSTASEASILRAGGVSCPSCRPGSSPAHHFLSTMEPIFYDTHPFQSFDFQRVPWLGLSSGKAAISWDRWLFVPQEHP